MDRLSITSCTWRTMDAWMIATDRLEVVITAIGAHVAAIRRRGEDLNPLWQPRWPALHPDKARPGGLYGGIEASLLATIVGHNLCLDRFGPPYPGENRPVHGETNTAHWSLDQREPGLVHLLATLPQAQLQVRTALAIAGDAILLTHGVKHGDAQAREVDWCEHVSVGDSFLAGAQISAGIERVYNWPGDSEPGSRFAAATSLQELPVAAALPMPLASDPACGDVVTAPVVAGWWTIDNPQLGKRLTYRWNERDFPWLTLWTQHRSRSGLPWRSLERVRGMELTTKPFPDGLRPADRHPTWLGRPTVCAVAPGIWKEHPLRIEWADSH